MHHISRNLAKAAATTALVIITLGGAATAASAAPNTGDGPKTDEERALDDACQAAYDTMEWAKSRRREPGDVYDRIADAAFWFLDNFCSDADFDTGQAPAPTGPVTAPTGPGSGVIGGGPPRRTPSLVATEPLATIGR